MGRTQESISVLSVQRGYADLRYKSQADGQICEKGKAFLVWMEGTVVMVLIRPEPVSSFEDNPIILDGRRIKTMTKCFFASMY